jgi:hypothetical protein
MNTITRAEMLDQLDADMDCAADQAWDWLLTLPVTDAERHRMMQRIYLFLDQAHERGLASIHEIYAMVDADGATVH